MRLEQSCEEYRHDDINVNNISVTLTQIESRLFRLTISMVQIIADVCSMPWRHTKLILASVSKCKQIEQISDDDDDAQ